MVEGTYYLIRFSRLHSGDLDNWEETAKTPEQALEIIEKTMKEANESAWGGKGNEEVTYSVYYVTAKHVILTKDVRVKVSPRLLPNKIRFKKLEQNSKKEI